MCPCFFGYMAAAVKECSTFCIRIQNANSNCLVDDVLSAAFARRLLSVKTTLQRVVSGNGLLTLINSLVENVRNSVKKLLL